jgi:protein-arginine kinase activator protein McsA
MLCQDCNKNEATIHLTQIVNNEKVVLNLCKACAEKRGFHSPFEQMPFPLAEIVSGMSKLWLNFCRIWTYRPIGLCWMLPGISG